MSVWCLFQRLGKRLDVSPILVRDVGMKSEHEQLQQIADAIGGTLTSSGSASIGLRKRKFVVDTAGLGRTKGSGTQNYGDEASAIKAAVADLIKDGVIGGISAASQKILQSGQDLHARSPRRRRSNPSPNSCCVRPWWESHPHERDF